MRIATDTGGTFTDLVVEEDDGTLTLHKAPTVPGDPVAGVLDALMVAAVARGITLEALLHRCDHFIHGTTHAINAVITGNTARTALIVTEGHRDILLFREGGRSEPFNNTIPYPRPFVPRALTFEVKERIIADGSILVPLDIASAESAIQAAVAEGVEAIAVCLLWSPVNAVHENALGEMIGRLAPDLPFTLSHAVNPTLREFRRASSAAIDASLKPLMAGYLGGLEGRLRAAGYRNPVMILTSAGGMVATADVAQQPISVVNSGPSMAPVAGRYYAAREGGWRTAIVADTGGTTYDISLVSEGRIPMTRDLWIGEPFRGELAGYPSVEVKSIGAGGGSIAFVDAAGLLRVGPQSAGSSPGPVCYGRGGSKPTVSDACVVLGYIDPEYFLGGKMKLDREGACVAIERDIAKPLAITVEEAAWSILDLATENMVQAIEDAAVAQGIDPAQAVLIGGGGAAGLNSVYIARRLGCHTLLIPETGAVMSATGALLSDVTREFARSVHSSTRAFDLKAIRAALADLEVDAENFAARSGSEQHIASMIVEARYEGQAWTIDVPVERDHFQEPESVAGFRALFHKMHEQLFTIRDEASEVEIVGLRLRVACPVRRSNESLPIAPPAARPPADRQRQVYFTDTGWTTTPVVAWDTVPPDTAWRGPMLVESPLTVVVIDPSSSFRRSREGALLIEVDR